MERLIESDDNKIAYLEMPQNAVINVNTKLLPRFVQFIFVLRFLPVITMTKGAN